MPVVRRWLSATFCLALVPATTALAQPVRQAAPVRLDRYGDPLPEGALARLGTIRLRTPNGPRHLAFTPDGRSLAGSDGQEVYFWDVRTGKLLRSLTTVDGTGPPFFSPDGKSLLRGAGKGFVRWDLATGEPGQRVSTAEPVKGSALSPDGKLLATYAEGGWPVHVWEAATGKALGRFPLQSPELRSLHWVPGTPKLALLRQNFHSEPQLDLLDVASGKVTRFRADPPLCSAEEVPCVAFAPDGRTFAAGGGGHVIRLFDLRTGKEVGRFRGHTAPVRQLRFAPGGKILASVDQGGHLRLWALPGGGELGTIQAFAPDPPLTFSPDGKTLAIAGTGCEVRLYEAATGKGRLLSPPPYRKAWPVGFSPDGKTLVVQGDGVRSWDTATARECRPPLAGFSGASVALCPDGTTLAVQREHFGVELWDVGRGKELATLAPLQVLNLKPGGLSVGPRPPLALSADGKTVAVLDPHLRTTTVHDVPTRKRRNSFTNPEGGWWCAALSPKGKLLAVCTGGSVWVFDTARGKPVFQRSRQGEVMALAFSPDGRSLALVTREHGVSLWEVASGRVRWRRRDLFPHPSAIAFSPDGTLLAVADWNAVSLWDVPSGKRVGELHEPSGHLWGVVFSPDGRRIATGSWGATVLIWDVESCRSELVRPGASALGRQPGWAR
jgi:WD40 repeat protein